MNKYDAVISGAVGVDTNNTSYVYTGYYHREDGICWYEIKYGNLMRYINQPPH